MTETANADQIAYWNDAAGQTWAGLQAELDRQLEGLGEAAMARLDPKPGERILDIGCGSGQTSLALARRVGPEGLVVGVDISRPLLEAAQRRIAEAGAARVRFLEADAQAYPFDPAAFDAAFSRFGVMFFADPPAAFANIRRALKPGGRLTFVCWRTMMENPWMTVPLAAGLAHLPPPEPPVPGAPGPFAFADAERVRGILQAAGFSGIEILPHDALVGGNDMDSALRTALRVGPLGMLMRDNPHARDAVEASVREAIAANMIDGRLRLPSATWIVSARND